jgi:hypothetical protein
LTADIRSAYLQVLSTGQPEVLRQHAGEFEAKYHYLAARLRDVADVLGNLKGVA